MCRIDISYQLRNIVFSKSIVVYWHYPAFPYDKNQDLNLYSPIVITIELKIKKH